MKKYAIFVMTFFFGLNSLMANPPKNDYPPEERDKEHKAPARRLRISLDDNVVTINSPYIINNVEIIIRDTTGGVIYQETLEELDYTFLIYLPEEETANAESIELTYGDQHIVKNIGK